MIHLIYNSATCLDFSKDDLVALFAKARTNNASMGVTGILLFVEGSFFQVLEGPEQAVDALADRIASDPRHDQMTVIIRESIAERSFGEWTMGFAEMSAQELSELAGMNDFFDARTSLSALQAGRAKKLLTAFAKGRWRVRVGERAPRSTAADVGVIAPGAFAESRAVG